MCVLYLMTFDTDISLDSESWNIGAGYVQHCILVPIVRCNKFIRIALRGTEEIEDSIQLLPDVKALLRKEALERLYDELQLIIANSNFKILSKDKDKIKSFVEDLEKAKGYFNKSFKVEENHIKQTKTINIKNEAFDKCLGILRKVHTEILFCLDRSHLIFKQSESVDLDKLIKQIQHGG